MRLFTHYLKEHLATHIMKRFIQLFLVLTFGALKAQGLSYPKDKQLYVFVSASMKEKNLARVLKDAKEIDAYVVLKGLKDNSYSKTLEHFSRIIEQTNYGFIVDPELFDRFEIEEVPAFVLVDEWDEMGGPSKTPVYDKISGNITLAYAMSKFISCGEVLNRQTEPRGK